MSDEKKLVDIMTSFMADFHLFRKDFNSFRNESNERFEKLEKQHAITNIEFKKMRLCYMKLSDYSAREPQVKYRKRKQV